MNRMVTSMAPLAPWLVALITPMPMAWSQDVPPTIGALNIATDPAPKPPDEAFNALVKSKPWLQVLGKALFWDSGLGSDGQACASCHFHAGADPRTINQLSPGLKVLPLADVAFGGIAPVASNLTGGGFIARPNIQLQAADFPFHRLADITDRNSSIVYDTNDVASSAGVFDGTLLSIEDPLLTKKGKRDLCSPVLDATTIFKVDVAGPRRTRKVEPRNTPTVINAAYFFRNFWDGRANNVFNGATPLGVRDLVDPQNRILRNTADGLVPEALSLVNSSLASQAVGPPGSNFEMACAGRPFAYIGRKLIGRRALQAQSVSSTDSLFSATPAGNLSRAPIGGLTLTYKEMIENAFQDDLWNATGLFVKGTDGNPLPGTGAGAYSQMEWNFSLVFGLAIDAYERLLISDKSPFDEYKRGKTSAMTPQQVAGMEIFTGKGKCVNCHTGPLLSGAAVPPRQREELIENMVMGDGADALYDGGFYNIGVRPTKEDIGLGAEIPDGIPLSFTRQLLTGPRVDDFPDPNPRSTDRAAVDGAFKVPTLRNVALTAPYFHNGGESTLRGVVEFYNRGGNRRGEDGNDTTGFGVNGSNLDPDIHPLGLSEQEMLDLVEFLKALTDSRVACHKAPFDHPGLKISNGHFEVTPTPTKLRDRNLLLRAVGKAGFKKPSCDPNTGDLFGRDLMIGDMLKPAVN